ncbi:MAG: ATP-binding protein, partial [Nitrososphaera sp.]
GVALSDLALTTVIITSGAMAALFLLIMRTVMAPVSQITEAIRTLATGNFLRKIYRGRLSKSAVRNANELNRALMMLEIMRRKVLEVKKNLSDSMKSKALDLQRINDELVENEEILKKANAQLAAQAEEFKRMNEELSSKNEELSETNAKLQKLDEMKDDFISIAAQELCGPIEPILESAERAEKGRISDVDALKAIVSHSKRLADVANSILDVGKIESGTFTYDMKPLGIKKLMDEITLDSTGLSGEERVANVNVDMDPGGDIMIIGDRERLKHAFSGLVNNAGRFAKHGMTTVQIRANHEKGLVGVRITDSGPRMPADIMPLLFDKYVARTRESERGGDLGLFITKTIIEAHGGTITAENNVGTINKGITFMVSLPMQVQRIHPQRKELETASAN